MLPLRGGRGFWGAAFLVGAGVGALALATAGCGGDKFQAGDAGATADGGPTPLTDAGDAGPHGPSFCATHTGFDFCSDFDDGQIKPTWDALISAGNATIAVDGTDGTAPSVPNVLLATATSIAANGKANATVSKGKLSKANATIDFDVRLSALNWPNVNDALASDTFILVTQGTYSAGLALRPDPSGSFDMEVVEVNTTPASATASAPLAHPIPLDTWSHVRLDLTLGLSSSTLKVTVDANPPETLTLSPPATAAAASTERTLTLGLTGKGALGQTSMSFDDVTYQHSN